MATILVHLRTHPGREADFERVVAELWRQTHGKETGVRRYEYWRGAETSTYYALLSFADHNAFIIHQASDHHETMSPQLRDVVASMRLEWVDPLADASDLPATEPQSLPIDATTREGEQAQRFPAEVQEWWHPLRRRDRVEGDVQRLEGA
jgi:quinol monooxygenase YgiN